MVHEYCSVFRLLAIRVEVAYKEITPVRCSYGSFKFEVMLLGLMNAPAISGIMINKILKHLSSVRIYIDDFVTHS